MNVLLTAGGRRNYLVRYFKAALQGRGRVLVADSDWKAPALYEADQVVCLPLASESHYIDKLFQSALENDVRLIVPLNDLELEILAAHRPRFEAVNIHVAIADREVVSACLDKVKTSELLRSLGVPHPKTFASLDDVERALSAREVSFPIVVKPRWGSGSIAVEIVEDHDELRAAFLLAHRRIARSPIHKLGIQSSGSRIVAQEFIPGEEFGLDVINDLSGRHITTIIRRKLGMRAGETDRAEILNHDALAQLGTTLGRSLRHRGNLDVDVILGPSGPVVIELNPRFGGGYPFSHEAGANLPLALLSWASGGEMPPAALAVTHGLLFAKYELLMPLRPPAGS